MIQDKKWSINQQERLFSELEIVQIIDCSIRKINKKQYKNA
jgi:hypothetical protein